MMTLPPAIGGKRLDRRSFVGGLGAAALQPLAARAQQQPVLGVLATSPSATFLSSGQSRGFLRGLDEAGFAEGRNLAIEWRWGGNSNDRLTDMAADLVARKVDAIVAQAPPAARAAKAATTTIPVVFGVGVDPVAEGLVASLARPGGNMTGVTLLSADLMAKRLGLMIELVPKAQLIALLINPTNPNPWIGSVEELARLRGVRLLMAPASTEAELATAFAMMVQAGAEAVVVGEDSPLNTMRTTIAQLALRHRLPTMGLLRQFAEVGGLASYGTDIADAYRLVGAMAGRILRGAKPADLAVQQAVRFEIVLNLKTAKALGLEVAPGFIAQADEVIE